MTTPNTPRVSQLHIYSYGIVGAVKELSSMTVEVMPVEDNVLADGVLSDNISNYMASGKDASGNSYQSTTPTTLTVQATWMPMGSNRMTAPDVRPGERVMLYRFGDTDKYYWVTIGSDMNLRKLETAVYAWNGSPGEGSGTTGDTSYFFEVSTHQKLVHFHTSKGNGEVCGFDVQINPGTGKVQVQDDLGNFFLLDAVNQILQLSNAAGTSMQIAKQNLTMVVPDTWNVQAKTANFKFNSWTITSTAGSKHLGDFSEFGAFGLNGDMTTAANDSGAGSTGTGEMTIAANMNLKGDATITGTTTTKQLTSQENIIAPNVN